MQNFTEIWEAVISEMRKDYSDSFVNLWFSEAQLLAITPTTSIIAIPSNFKRKMLEDKYIPTIKKYLKTVLDFDTDVVVLSSENGPPDISVYIDDTEMEASYTENEQEQLEKDDETKFEFKDENKFIQGDTRKRYTFENFLVGSSNHFAYAAALGVAREPATNYNPLFIYGSSGLGKTHLLYAITNHILNNDSDSKIMYVTGEDFTNQLIRSISNHSTEAFRQKFRNCSVLLIDDIQFIAGKIQTQEEFFHTFNVLYEEGKQIILTSDRHPEDINPLEDRIKSRFEWGLIVDIQPPDIELRIAIMKEKASKMGLSMPDEAYLYLAENITNNVRQLEGALKKIKAKSYLEGSSVTFEFAKSAISDMISGTPSTQVTLDRIISVVTQKYGVSINDLKSKKKTSFIVTARHKCVYLIRKLTDMSLTQIGHIFGKDHTTIMNSINNIENEIHNNSGFESEINNLILEIKGVSQDK